MKRLLLLILLFLPILSFSQVITDGLVGYWPFNGNANDESGNGLHLSTFQTSTFNPISYEKDRFHNDNASIRFINKISSYQGLYKKGAINTSQGLTICIWLKIDFTPQNNNTPLQFEYGNTFYVTRNAFHDDDAVIGSGASKFYPINSAQIVNQGWLHHAITISATGITNFYLNGSLISENVQLAPPIVKEIQLGWGTGGSPFDGWMDDLILYNRELTSQEITELYNFQKPPTPPVPELCDQIYCDEDNVGIGTPNTHGYKLAVAGNILTEEIKVATQPNWPDYVFEEDYPLTDLTELEGYIRKNKHLPEIPDALAIKEEGYNLGEMDAKLLEKIEQLTLYIIEQNKELIEQNKKIEFQNKNAEELIEEIEKLKEENRNQHIEIENLKNK